jgi:hypothetical protein
MLSSSFGNLPQPYDRRAIMKLRFLDKETKDGGSPTLFDTDRNTYLVQGWKVADPEILARLDLGSDETCVEVPSRLMAHLSKSELTDTEGAEPPVVIRTDRDTYVIKGRRVTDAEVLAQMKIPDHETVVEVSTALRIAMKEEYAVADA